MRISARATVAQLAAFPVFTLLHRHRSSCWSPRAPFQGVLPAVGGKAPHLQAAEAPPEAKCPPGQLGEETGDEALCKLGWD